MKLKIITLMTAVLSIAFLAGCQADKTSWGFATATDGVHVEPAGGGSGGSTLMSNVTIAGNATAVAKTNKDDKKPMFFCAFRKTLLGELFGYGAGEFACAYIGKDNETADESKKRIDSFATMIQKAGVKVAPSESSSTTTTVNSGKIDTSTQTDTDKTSK